MKRKLYIKRTLILRSSTEGSPASEAVRFVPRGSVVSISIASSIIFTRSNLYYVIAKQSLFENEITSQHQIPHHPRLVLLKSHSCYLMSLIDRQRWRMKSNVCLISINKWSQRELRNGRLWPARDQLVPTYSPTYLPMYLFVRMSSQRVFFLFFCFVIQWNGCC